MKQQQEHTFFFLILNHNRNNAEVFQSVDLFRYNTSNVVNLNTKIYFGSNYNKYLFNQINNSYYGTRENENLRCQKAI